MFYTIIRLNKKYWVRKKLRNTHYLKAFKIIIGKEQDLDCLISSLQRSFGFIWIDTNTKHFIYLFMIIYIHYS